MKLTKAVIPAAGFGTRSLPATKAIPKELLPVFDAPSILYVVEEALEANFNEIVLITGRGKSAVEDFFDVSYELEKQIEGTDKESLLSRVRAVRNHARFVSVRQGQALGLGHAVLQSEIVTQSDPFAVLLPDELDFSGTLGQLRKLYVSTNTSCVSVMKVPRAEVSKYGVISHKESSENATHLEVTDLVEKPPIELAPSDLALPGRYIFSPEIHSLLKTTPPGRGGEIQLTDAMRKLASTHGLLAVLNSGARFDCGDKLSFMKASLYVAFQSPTLQSELKTWVNS